MAERKKEQRFHNGIPIDSDEEYMFLIWIEELIEEGYIEKICRAETYLLSEKLVNSYKQDIILKTKTKEVIKNQTLLDEHVYTPEFMIYWSNIENGLFVHRLRHTLTDKVIKSFIRKSGEHTSCVEVKPEYDQNNMTRLFKLNQKWMWEKYKIFVNLIYPHKLFEQTFTPKLWLKTSSGKQRVIHWKIKTLEEYVREQSRS